MFRQKTALLDALPRDGRQGGGKEEIVQEETTGKGNGNDIREEAPEALEDHVDDVIRHHVYAALGVGLIPLPLLDFVGVTGIQLNMIRKLAQIYEIPFTRDMVKNLIGALIGGAFPASFGSRIASSVSKTVPGIGQALGAVTAPAVSGACTYAIGKVFSRHFTEGGSFLSFDPEEARAFYEEMFKEGGEAAGGKPSA